MSFRTPASISDGQCDVSPITGLAQVTVFRAECTGWSSEDSPLDYEFILVNKSGFVQVV